MISDPFEENRDRRFDSSGEQLSSSGTKEEESAMWERSVQESWRVISDSSLYILQEDLHTNLDRMCDALNSLVDVDEQIEQLGCQPIQHLQQVESQLRNYLARCKIYAQACTELGNYVSSRKFTTGLKNAVKQENVREIASYLDNIGDSLHTCHHHSTQIELDSPKLGAVLRQAKASANKSLLVRRRRASNGVAGASLSTSAVIVSVALASFLVDPLVTGPIAMGVVGSGLVVVGIAGLPLLVRYVRMRKEEGKVLNNITEALHNLDLSIQTTNEHLSTLRGYIENHSIRLRSLQVVKAGGEAPDTEASKDYICRQIDSLQMAMGKMVQKATAIARFQLPP